MNAGLIAHVPLPFDGDDDMSLGDQDPSQPKKLDDFFRGVPGRRWVTLSWPREAADVASPRLWRWRIIEIGSIASYLTDVLPPPMHVIAQNNRLNGVNITITKADGRTIDVDNLHFFGRLPVEMSTKSAVSKLIAEGGPVGVFNARVQQHGPAQAYRSVCRLYEFEEPFTAMQMWLWRDSGMDWAEMSESDASFGDAGTDLDVEDHDEDHNESDGGDGEGVDDDAPEGRVEVEDTDGRVQLEEAEARQQEDEELGPAALVEVLENWDSSESGAEEVQLESSELADEEHDEEEGYISDDEESLSDEWYLANL